MTFEEKVKRMIQIYIIIIVFVVCIMLMAYYGLNQVPYCFKDVRIEPNRYEGWYGLYNTSADNALKQTNLFGNLKNTTFTFFTCSKFIIKIVYLITIYIICYRMVLEEGILLQYEKLYEKYKSERRR